MAETRHVVDAETVHNWRNRYHNLPHYADLRTAARAAIVKAHDLHHSKGLDAREAAEGLIRDFPGDFYNGREG